MTGLGALGAHPGYTPRSSRESDLPEVNLRVLNSCSWNGSEILPSKQDPATTRGGYRSRGGLSPPSTESINLNTLYSDAKLTTAVHPYMKTATYVAVFIESRPANEQYVR